MRTLAELESGQNQETLVWPQAKSLIKSPYIVYPLLNSLPHKAEKLRTLMILIFTAAIDNYIRESHILCLANMTGCRQLGPYRSLTDHSHPIDVNVIC